MPEVVIEYSFIAVRPFKAEHPIGSGTVVSYEPGDLVPAEEWGNATHNMMEMGKIERLAVNVVQRGGQEDEEEAAPEPLIEEWEEEGVVYPVKGAGGWYTLSDGSRVQGQEAAERAEAELGG